MSKVKAVPLILKIVSLSLIFQQNIYLDNGIDRIEIFAVEVIISIKRSASSPNKVNDVINTNNGQLLELLPPVSRL